MIVCLCAGVSESEIKRCIKQGADTLEAIEESCGAGNCCQSCHPEILSLLAERDTCVMTPATGVSHEEKDFPYCRSFK